ncbi:MAG: DMT family transporter [Bradymonadales bacterium]|nr:MAG: DMT family transporter [Bradymonadales bacterium]
MSPKKLFLFCLLAAFWGGSFVAIKEVVRTIDPFVAAAARLVLASASLWILFGILGKLKRIEWKLAWRLWVVGLFSLAIPFCFLFWGAIQISAGLAGLLNASVPLWTTVFIFGLFRSEERADFSRSTGWGLLVGFVGVFLLFYPLLQVGQWIEILGATAVLVGASFYGLGSIFNRYYLTHRKDVSFSTLLVHQHSAAMLFLLFFSFFFADASQSSWRELSSSAYPILLLIYLGVISTALALWIYFYLIREIGSVRASAVTYLVPVFALLFDYLFFSEIPSGIQVFGAGMILVSIFFLRARAPQAENQKESNCDKGKA